MMRWAQFSRRAPARSFLAMCWWQFCTVPVWLTLRLMYRERSSGREHIPSHGPMIIASNHQSHLDPLFVGLACNDRVPGFIARDTLFGKGLLGKSFGWLMRSLGTIPLQRGGGGDRAAMRTAIDALKEGSCLIIFPEGRRCSDGRLAKMQAGVLTIARRANAPVLPVAIDGAHDVWPRSRSGPHLRGYIHTSIGPLIDVETIESTPPAELLEMLEARIDTLRLQSRSAIRDRSKGRVPPPGPADAPRDAAQPAQDVPPTSGPTPSDPTPSDPSPSDPSPSDPSPSDPTPSDPASGSISSNDSPTNDVPSPELSAPASVVTNSTASTSASESTSPDKTSGSTQAP